MAGDVRLGDVAEVIMGQSPPGETYNERGEGLPFFQGVADFTYRHPTPRVYCSAPSRIANPGDLLLSVRAPIGRLNVADRECAIGRGLSIIRARLQEDQRYLEFALRAKERDWHAIEGCGSVFGNATRNDLETLPLAWPEEAAYRRAIAHILGTLDDELAAKSGEYAGMRRVLKTLISKLVSGAWSVEEGQKWLSAARSVVEPLDDKIELNRRMSETLEAMARALFKSWFVDFDPVRAKMEGRWRRGESPPGLPAHLYDLFPDRLVDSELGEIPEGWEVAYLPDLIEINPPRPLCKGEIASYLDMANMPTRGHAPGQVVNRPFGSGMRFINGDTLVARITPCLENGKTAFVDFLQDGEVGWGSTEYIVLRPRHPLPDEFAYCLARSDAFREFAIQSMTGTSGRQRVQADSLEHFQLPRIPARVAEAFGRAIKPLFARASAAVRESRTLAALRDALLPKLISGKLRVKDADRFLKERGL